MEICIPITLPSLHSNTSLLHLLVTKMYSSIEVVVCIHAKSVLPTQFVSFFTGYLQSVSIQFLNWKSKSSPKVGTTGTMSII